MKKREYKFGFVVLHYKNIEVYFNDSTHSTVSSIFL